MPARLFLTRTVRTFGTPAPHNRATARRWRAGSLSLKSSATTSRLGAARALYPSDTHTYKVFTPLQSLRNYFPPNLHLHMFAQVSYNNDTQRQQGYSKTVEGWLALAQVVRYHQPPGRRPHAIRLEYWPDVGNVPAAETQAHVSVLREVFPTLTALAGPYRNMYWFTCQPTQPPSPILEMLESSGCTHN